MNTFLWSSAVLLTLFVTAESLLCNTCDVKILGTCIGTTPINCTASQNQCYSGVAKFSGGLVDIYAKGCIEKSACVNQTGSILTTTYSITRTCCSTNLCNGAAPIQLPLTAALGAALVALWSQWGL